MTGSHPAIVPKKEWEAAQIERRKSDRDRNYNANEFAGRIICGDCGSPYGPKVWHSTDPRRRKTVWQCNNKFSGRKCSTPHPEKEDIKAMFVKIQQQLYADRDRIIEDLKLAINSFDIDSFERKISSTEEQMTTVNSDIELCIKSNASAMISESEYRQRYDELLRKFNTLEEKHNKLYQEKELYEIQTADMTAVLKQLNAMESYPTQFKPNVWRTQIEKAVVGQDGTVTFHLVGGMEIELKK